jgi:hypothetical protein
MKLYLSGNAKQLISDSIARMSDADCKDVQKTFQLSGHSKKMIRSESLKKKAVLEYVLQY